MANTVAAYPGPDALGLSTGQTLRSSRVNALPVASNWIRAYLGARSLVSQSFPYVNGAYTYSDVKGAFTTPSCQWRIPETTRGRTTVDIRVFAGGPAGAELRFASVTGGGSKTIAINGAPAWHSDTLTINAAAGFDTITMESHGAGAVAATVGHVAIAAQVLTSPLAAGLNARDSFTAFDAPEFLADEPLSADAMARLRTNLAAFRDTPQMYCSESSVDEVAGVSDYFHARPHVWPAPVWLGSERNRWELTVHFRATGDVGETHIILGSGTRYGPTQEGARVTIGAAAAEAWYTATLQLENPQRVLSSMGPGYETTLLYLWPVGTSATRPLPAALHTVDTRLTTCSKVKSVCAWGR